MSTSLNVDSMAYVFCAPFSLSATRRRRRVILTRLQVKQGIYVALGFGYDTASSSKATTYRSGLRPAPEGAGVEVVAGAAEPTAAGASVCMGSAANHVQCRFGAWLEAWTKAKSPCQPLEITLGGAGGAGGEGAAGVGFAGLAAAAAGLEVAEPAARASGAPISTVATSLPTCTG